MKPLKVVLFALFFQLIIEAQDVLVLGFQIDSTFMSIHFVSGQPLFSFCEDTWSKNHVLEKMNALILHSYKISYVYDLLLN
jgi:hypothetical protein